MNSTCEDREVVRRLNGIYVGLLEMEELAAFDRCVADGFARRNFDGASGFLGLSKVQYLGHVKAENRGVV